MSILTNSVIESMLGGRVLGTEAYNSLCPTDAVKAQYIKMADAAVVSAARKGGYSTVSSTGPVPALGTEANDMLQAMAFKVWIRLAYGYGKAVAVNPEIDAHLPDPSELYSQADGARIDLPGMERDLLGGDGGSDLQSGGTLSSPTVAQFGQARLRWM
jgi:hypothetical protein